MWVEAHVNLKCESMLDIDNGFVKMECIVSEHMETIADMNNKGETSWQNQ